MKFYDSGNADLFVQIAYIPRVCCYRSELNQFTSLVNWYYLLTLLNVLLVCVAYLCVSSPFPRQLVIVLLPLPVVVQQWQLEALVPQVSAHGMQVPQEKKITYIDFQHHKFLCQSVN